jgi:hypothetical protein
MISTAKSRTGKIARLPCAVRDALNRRLMDGMEGGRLLAWLNAQFEVREVLRRDFASVPVSRQNLSQWRLGGYQDWLRRQEACERIRAFTEKACALTDAAGNVRLSDRLAALLTAQLAEVATALLEATADPVERWKLLQPLIREVGRLRHGDHSAGWLNLESERWNSEGKKGGR